jgi:predicted nucleic acid-binding protein
VKLVDACAGVKRLFLDSAPVIYHVQATSAYQPLTDWVFQQLQAGAFEAVTSPITLAECLVLPIRQGDTALAQQFRNVITRGRQTIYFGIDAVTENAAELRARYNLSLTDAFQVAPALAAGCQAILTNDLGLKRVTELAILVLDELEL